MLKYDLCFPHTDSKVSYLHYRVDVYEVQALDLVRLNTVWALHPGQHTNNLLCQGTAGGKWGI